MANVSYTKGVRTKYRNTLSSEILSAKDVLSRTSIFKFGDCFDIEQTLSDTTKCLEKIKLYCEKVETQSEKLATALDDSDKEFTEQIVEDDCKLCSEAMENYFDLCQFKEDLLAAREKVKVKVESQEEKMALKMVQLHEDMQQLLHKQMVHQENSSKIQKENTSFVKLPKINIITFSGDKTKWIEFWDSFNCAVHENKNISNVEKFNYLRSKLVGEAKSAISGLALSSDNYPVAVDVLTKRFGNPQEIIDLHYNRLINLPPATSKVQSLRHILDEVEKHLRSLEVLHQDIKQNVFISIIRSKLPEEVLLQLELKNGADIKWTISSLTEHLREYVLARERAMHTPKNATDKQSSQASHPVSSKSDFRRRPAYESDSKNRTQTLATNSAKQPIPRKSQDYSIRKCRYCQKPHWSDECTEYQTIIDRKQKIKGSCYKCLRDGHSFKDCKTNKPCVYCGEMNVHHRSLCPKKFKLKHSVSHVVSEVEKPQQKSDESGLMSTNEMVLMQTALTEIRNPENYDSSPVRIFLDSGSHRSYITEDLAKKLDLKEEGEQDIHLVTFGSKTAKRVTTKYAELEVKLKSGKHLQITANIVPVISGELQRRPVKDLYSDTVQDIVRTVELADTIPSHDETTPIELLIGNDYYLDLVHGEKIQIQEGLYLLASKLGWILTGRVKDNSDTNLESSMLILTCGNDVNRTSVFASIDASLPSKPNLEDFWNIESIGIVDKEVKSDDMVAMEKFKDTLHFENDRYQVTWPWKEDKPELPTNRDLAMKRLKTSMCRMRNKPDILQKYNAVVSDQLEKGVIEKVNTNESDGLLHYLPHHAVINPQKTTTKLRVVYDASAKTRQENSSLNECLYRGPVMLRDLCGMLMRFRLHPIAIVADIEKAFLQIGLQTDQRDVTRFIWLKDINQPTVDENSIQEYRFSRVPFGVISSPFLLGATIEHHLDTYNSDIAQKVKNDIYVDNVITGTASVQEAKELYKTSKKMFKECSMNLREWISNSEEVNETFETQDRADIGSMKVLGHNWDVKQDMLSFKPVSLYHELNAGEVTKRVVLKRMASLFDPLGLICPVIVRGKSFLQSLWSKRLDWDDPINEDDKLTWCSIAKDMDNVAKCCLQRHMPSASSSERTYRLLCFCDASEKAYAAVVYLHQTTEANFNTECDTQLMFAKTRLAPAKKLSIPRLELLAVVIGIRCLTFVKNQIKLPIVESCLWSDSQCVLHWITSDKKLSVFVKNRVKEIRDASEDTRLAYIPTHENPADVGSRGASVDQLMKNELWWKGPTWLLKHPSSWPTFEKRIDSISEVKYKSEIQNPKKETILVQHSTETQPICMNSPLGIDIDKFSSFTKLLRVTALALRFIRRLQRRPCSAGYITSDELQDAELRWIQHVQAVKYTDVIASIDNNKPSCTQRQLGLYIDKSGIIRCKGRLENSCLSESARCPILLPKDHKFTHLVIEKTHKEILHSGVSQTLSTVRLRFWITHGRAAVKAVIKTCSVCRRYEGGPYKMPPMCPYPKGRVTESSPFSRTGLDYMGPLYIKSNGTEQKVWICLFTCLVTRAIHLELVCDLSTSEFLLCFRRFVAQRGTPTEIISDNALQFRTASDVLARLWKHIQSDADVLDYVSNSGIKWRFNVELAPWMGGFYERLVGLVKRSLRKTVGRRLLTLIQLQTFLKEIESVINSRPLVYVGDDVNSSIPLTPASFLTLNPNVGIPNTEISSDNDYVPIESTSDKLIQTWKKGQKLLDMFWKIWRQDYLTSLRERTQTKLKSPRVQSDAEPKENDIVLIKDDLSRGKWKFGRICSLVRSRDGYIRSVTVKTPSGRELGRPINLLYPLETSISPEGPIPQDDIQTSKQQANPPKPDQKPPRRLAFEKANSKIRSLAREDSL